MLAEWEQRFLLVNLFLPRPIFLRNITKEDFELLVRCQGNLTFDQISKELNQSLDEIQQRLLFWEHEAPGMFFLTPVHQERKQMAQEALRLRRVFQSAKGLDQDPDLSEYHEKVIANAIHQFEEIETTVSHMYHSPHKGLCNRTYGGAFCDKLLTQKTPKPVRILEIGCGVGYFARGFLDRLKTSFPDSYKTVHYTMFDLSPALQESQKKICQSHQAHLSFISGNILNYDFGVEKFDIIIANEMIADLPVEAAHKGNIDKGAPQNQAEKDVIHFELNRENSPALYLVNTGAIQLVQKIKGLLGPQGHSVITEYGSLLRFPESVKLGEHNEYSIRFDDLVRVSRSIGLEGHYTTVGEMLGFDENLEVLSAESYGMLSSHLLPYLGKKRLQRCPYDRELYRSELKDLADKIHNVRFYPLRDAKDLLSPFRFIALSLSCP